MLRVSRRDLRGEPGAEVVVLRDGTDEERQRLERFAGTMQTLAALSHKINNPLTALMGRAQILRIKGAGDPQVGKAAEVIEESARRIADYIRELATVVKQASEEALERPLEVSAASRERHRSDGGG